MSSVTKIKASEAISELRRQVKPSYLATALIYLIHYEVVISQGIYNYNGGTAIGVVSFSSSAELTEKDIKASIRSRIEEKIGTITIISVIIINLLE